MRRLLLPLVPLAAEALPLRKPAAPGHGNISDAASFATVSGTGLLGMHDGEATGAEALVQCKSSLIPGGKYESYANTTRLVCRHGNFLTSYHLDLKAPSWSAYKITPQDIAQEKGGRRKFKSDPGIPSEDQEPLYSKCWGQTWNRGHLCPSYIMSWNKTADGPWDDTYFITNTAMQWGPFNQQTWVHLEKHVASWIQAWKPSAEKPSAEKLADDGIYIVTGTWFQKDKLTKCDLNTGEIVEPDTTSTTASPTSWMGVPDFYYKILCDVTVKKSIAYIGHNRKDDGVHEMTVAELEKHLGLDLLPDESCSKGTKDTEYWWTEDLGESSSYMGPFGEVVKYARPGRKREGKQEGMPEGKRERKQEATSQNIEIQI